MWEILVQAYLSRNQSDWARGRYDGAKLMYQAAVPNVSVGYIMSCLWARAGKEQAEQAAQAASDARLDALGYVKRG